MQEGFKNHEMFQITCLFNIAKQINKTLVLQRKYDWIKKIEFCYCLGDFDSNLNFDIYLIKIM